MVSTPRAEAGTFPWPGCLRSSFPARRRHVAGAAPGAFSSGALPASTCPTGGSRHEMDGARLSWGRQSALHHAPFAAQRVYNSGSDNLHKSACLSRKGTSGVFSRRIASGASNLCRDQHLGDHHDGGRNKCESCRPAFHAHVSICRRVCSWFNNKCMKMV
jgi:hypothetical protein